jgi:hypothetical protein
MQNQPILKKNNSKKEQTLNDLEALKKKHFIVIPLNPPHQYRIF